jgi:D-amino-acid dehydrogenase
MAHVAVIGAGVVGVASAYMLCTAGHKVTLIDRNAAPAQGASFANGAQLSYAYCDALASPALAAKLPHILLGRDPAFRVGLSFDPEFLVWSLRLLANARQRTFLDNTCALLELAQRSRALMQTLMADLDLPFDHAPSGKMILYGTAAACDATADLRALKTSLGIVQHVLDQAEATTIEPALQSYPDPIARVVYSPDDAAGRPNLFCAALTERMKARYGLHTMFGQKVRSLLISRGAISGLTFERREPLACDMVVVATGAATDLLPRSDRPWGTIWPVRGYSLTAPATVRAMRVSITDLKRKIVFARLGHEVRAAGLADIGPRSAHFDAARFTTFKAAAVEAFGDAFAHQSQLDLAAWSGARPCTPSSRPIIKPGRLKGLFLNLGHGTLGWTLCLGSAARLLALVTASASGQARSRSLPVEDEACS